MRVKTVLSHRQRRRRVSAALKEISLFVADCTDEDEGLRLAVEQFYTTLREDAKDFSKEPWLKRHWDRAYNHWRRTTDVLVEAGIPVKARRGDQLNEADFLAVRGAILASQRLANHRR